MLKGHHFRFPHFGQPQRGYGVSQKSENKEDNLHDDHEDHYDQNQEPEFRNFDHVDDDSHVQNVFGGYNI